MRKASKNWKYIFAQSTYITAAWTWFMILAGKAAEPVLVVSVLYASVKLLPIVHFAPQFDVAVFIAQFVALDVGGLSLNKLADQAKKEGNEDGAKQAKRLSLALVAVMLVGVIMAGVDQVIKLEGQVGTVIDTILLIARAVMAVLYSRVIHSLKKDDELESGLTYSDDEVKELLAEVVVSEAITKMREEIITYLTTAHEAHLTELDLKQAEALGRFKEEQTKTISETTETITSMVDTTLRKRREAVRNRETEKLPALTSKIRSIADASSRRQATSEVDAIIWPLLNTGMTVRAIAARANTSTATVGRSRQRWEASHKSAAMSRRGMEGETMEGLS